MKRKRSGKLGPHPSIAGVAASPAGDTARLRETIDGIFKRGDASKIEHLCACVTALAQGEECKDRETVSEAVLRILSSGDAEKVSRLYTRIADVEQGGLGLGTPRRLLGSKHRRNPRGRL
jgi:hypothetical protein